MENTFGSRLLNRVLRAMGFPFARLCRLCCGIEVRSVGLAVVPGIEFFPATSDFGLGGRVELAGSLRLVTNFPQGIFRLTGFSGLCRVISKAFTEMPRETCVRAIVRLLSVNTPCPNASGDSPEGGCWTTLSVSTATVIWVMKWTPFCIGRAQRPFSRLLLD